MAETEQVESGERVKELGDSLIWALTWIVGEARMPADVGGLPSDQDEFEKADRLVSHRLNPTPTLTCLDCGATWGTVSMHRRDCEKCCGNGEIRPPINPRYGPAGPPVSGLMDPIPDPCPKCNGTGKTPTKGDLSHGDC